MLAVHKRLYHANLELDDKDFTLSVSRGQRDKLGRQAEEGVRIVDEIRNRDRIALQGPREGEKDKVEKIIIMNSRREFLQPLGGIRTTTSYL